MSENQTCICTCHNGGFCQGCQCNLMKVENFYKPKNSESTLELKQQISDIREKLEEAMKMEWTSRPLNNLAASYCNLTAASKEMRDQINVLEKRFDTIEGDHYAIKDFIDEDDLEAWKGIMKETKAIQSNILMREMDRDKRIEALENAGRQPSPWAMDKNVCALQRRIETIEAVRKEDGYLIDDLKSRVDMQYSLINKYCERIEALEKQVASHESDHESVSKTLCRHNEIFDKQHERIEALEAKELMLHNDMVDNILNRLCELENPEWHQRPNELLKRIEKLEDHAHDHIVEPNAQFMVIPLKKKEELPKVTCEHIEPTTTGTPGQVVKLIDGKYQWCDANKNLTFEEALVAMRKGKKVKLSINKKDIILYIDFKDACIMTPINDGHMIWPMHIMATDWEIIE